MSPLADLAFRMQALKDTHDTQVTSEDKTPTPLWVFLYIYNSANSECYINYMDGAEKLVRYLSPIEMPVLPLTSLPLPRIVLGYELTALAQLLSPTLTISNINESLTAVRVAELAIIQETLANAQREIRE